MATARWRPPPDYLIIGAKRGGTTSLHAYLGEHPGVMSLFPRPQKIKGTYFFDEGYSRGTKWYLSHFPTRSEEHTSEIQSLMRISYAVFCSKKQNCVLYGTNH